MVLPFAVWKSDGMNLAWFFCLLAHEVNLENWISNISYTKSCKWMNFFNLSLMIHVVQVNFRWLTLTFLSWVVFWCPCWNITTCVKNSLCQVYIIYIVFMQFILANINFFSIWCHRLLPFTAVCYDRKFSGLWIFKSHVNVQIEVLRLWWREWNCWWCTSNLN